MKLIIKILIVFIFSSCSVLKNNAFLLPEGEFECDNGVRIILEHNQFLIIDECVDCVFDYSCKDTISYGLWRLENELIVLESPPLLNISMIEPHVSEFTRENNDSLLFTIKNPIQDNFKGDKDKRFPLTYRLSVTSDNFGLDSKIVQRFHKEGDIRFSNIPKASIIKFQLNIYTENIFGERSISTREITTFEYIVREMNSNHFIISMPELTYCYLSMKRLNNDYIKVLSKNELKWDGCIFKRL